MDIAIKDEHCMQVQTGRTVVWNGDLDEHPLGGFPRCRHGWRPR